MRLLRNQVLALAGHRPGRADALEPFACEYPAVAAAMGLAPDPERSAERLVAAFQSLSTRVDGA